MLTPTRSTRLHLGIALLVVGLLLTGALFLTQRVQAQTAVSVCTITGLNGPAQQENLLYCANGTSIAPSTYPEAIALAQQKHIIVGTPEQVIETIDWAGCPITSVPFSYGYHAEHHNVGDACNHGDLTVRYYAPGPPSTEQVWP